MQHPKRNAWDTTQRPVSQCGTVGTLKRSRFMHTTIQGHNGVRALLAL